MTRVLLIRHGRTAWNAAGVFRGRVDMPLSKEGHRQAQALAVALTGETLAAIYSSPLLRALQTAAALGGRARGLDPVCVDGLVDISYGRWEGRTQSEVEATELTLYTQWLEKPNEVRPPAGETLGEVEARALSALDEITRSHPGETIAVVSHRVVTKVLLCSILGLGPEGFWRIRQHTCCLNVVEQVQGRWVVSSLNDICHLSGIPLDAADF